MSLITACNLSSSEFPKKIYLDNRVQMQTPQNWVSKPVSNLWMHDPRDSVFIIEIGTNRQNARITAREQKHMIIQDLTSQRIIEDYYKSHSSAKFLSVATDSVQNKAVIEYLADDETRKQLVYFCDVTIVQGRKWVRIELHGPNTIAFKDTIRKMVDSIIIPK